MKAPVTGNKASEHIIVPVGLHKAVCISVVDLGTQQVEYNWEEKSQRKMRMTFELPNLKREFDGEEKPLVIGKKYTFSMYERANLAQDLEGRFSARQAEDFDFSLCLWRSAQIQVIHDKVENKTYAKIKSILPLQEEIKPFNELVLFDLSDFKQEVFDKLPKFMQDDIIKSKEYEDRENTKIGTKEYEDSDEIPFNPEQ